jgi:hypothetical protein
VRVEFVRTRSIVREFFPNVAVYVLACGMDLPFFDSLAVRGAFSHSRPSTVMAEMLMTIVTDCLLDIVTPSLQKKMLGGDLWKLWSGEQEKHHRSRVREAIRRVTTALAPLAETDDRKNPDYAKVLRKQRLISSDAFEDSAVEAVRSVIRVLASSQQEFAKEKSDVRSDVFNDMFRGIGEAAGEAAAYEGFAGEPLARWLVEGEVLALAPAGHVWSKLLLESRVQLKQVRDRFLVNQLACILSLWHRAVTGARSPRNAVTAFTKYLVPLRLVREKNIEERPPHPKR